MIIICLCRSKNNTFNLFYRRVGINCVPITQEPKYRYIFTHIRTKTATPATFRVGTYRTPFYRATPSVSRRFLSDLFRLLCFDLQVHQSYSIPDDLRAPKWAIYKAAATMINYYENVVTQYTARFGILFAINNALKILFENVFIMF